MNLEERMYALIKECEASGLSQKAFCMSKQIKLPTFQYWRQKQRRVAQNNFVPILTNKSVPDSGSIEVVYPHGT